MYIYIYIYMCVCVWLTFPARQRALCGSEHRRSSGRAKAPRIPQQALHHRSAVDFRTGPDSISRWPSPMPLSRGVPRVLSTKSGKKRRWSTFGAKVACVCVCFLLFELFVKSVACTEVRVGFAPEAFKAQRHQRRCEEAKLALILECRFPRDLSPR